MVSVNHLLWVDAFLVCPNSDGSAVSIAAGDHQDVVSHHAVVTGEDIGAQIAAGNMAKMKWAVGIRPSHGYKNTFWNTFRQEGNTRDDLRIWA